MSSEIIKSKLFLEFDLTKRESPFFSFILCLVKSNSKIVSISFKFLFALIDSPSLIWNINLVLNKNIF